MPSNDYTTDAVPTEPAGTPEPQESTPLFDATLQTLPAPPGDVVAEHTTDPDDPAAAQWPESEPSDEIDEWYGADEAEPAIDPQTREGRAIMRLFRMLKEGENEDCYPPSRWNAGDTTQTVCEWLSSLGIDPDESAIDAGQRLTLATRARPGQSLRAADYTVRIDTENADAADVLIPAMSALAKQLGPGTGLLVLDADDRIIARHEHPALTTPS